jgi:hypothetical protein
MKLCACNCGNHRAALENKGWRRRRQREHMTGEVERGGGGGRARNQSGPGCKPKRGKVLRKKQLSFNLTTYKTGVLPTLECCNLH